MLQEPLKFGAYDEIQGADADVFKLTPYERGRVVHFTPKTKPVEVEVNVDD